MEHDDFQRLWRDGLLSASPRNHPDVYRRLPPSLRTLISLHWVLITCIGLGGPALLGEGSAPDSLFGFGLCAFALFGGIVWAIRTQRALVLEHAANDAEFYTWAAERRLIRIR